MGTKTLNEIFGTSVAIISLSYLFFHGIGRYSQYLAEIYDKYFQEHARNLLKQLIDVPRPSIKPFTSFLYKDKVFKNRIIKAATYEALCDKNGVPLPQMIDFHNKMAIGGCGMSIVAYGAISSEGRSFPAQLICREQSIPMLKMLTDSLHSYNCLACIQITHAGYFSDRSLSEKLSYHEQMSAQSIFNPAAFSFCRAMSATEEEKIEKDFVNAALVSVRSGFDCLEIHCGHGYLLSQYLSPKLNPNQSFFKRLSFPLRVLTAIRKAIDMEGTPCLLMIKMNLSDGTKEGLYLEESSMMAIEFAKCGVDIIGLSGGLILENGLFMLRGGVPLNNMISATTDALKKVALYLFGKILIPQFSYQERYFQDPALYVAKRIQQWKNTNSQNNDVKVCYIGGVHTYESVKIITQDLGFDFIQSGRAILYDADIVNRWESEWKREEDQIKSKGNKIIPNAINTNEQRLNSLCSKCNYCIVDATMKQKPISCIEW